MWGRAGLGTRDRDVRLLFVSHNYPPEVNAPARRLQEHARQWVADGGRVRVLTAPPHYPEGAVYRGYANARTRELDEGIELERVPIVPLANAGVVRRCVNFASFLASATWHGTRLDGSPPDVVAATTPQLLSGLAGYLVAKRLGVPFVLEVRDLWPESIVAAGVDGRSRLVASLERLSNFLYAHADHVVVLSDAFREHLLGLGVPSSRVTVIKNGVIPETFAAPDPARVREVRARHGLEGRFVVSYIGTTGDAHGLEVVLEAARRCPDPEVVFLVMGTGNRRGDLEEAHRRLGAENVVLVPKRPHEDVPAYYGASDAALVHLRRLPAFRKVLPSKMFEAWAAGRPILLGVEGEARSTLLRAGGGLAFEPGSADALLEALGRLRADPSLAERMGRAGQAFVREEHDRRRLAARYWATLETVSRAGARARASGPSLPAGVGPVTAPAGDAVGP